MFTAIIFVCLAATPVKECNSNSALMILNGPERLPSAIGCMVNAQLYASQLPLIQELRDGEYVKVLCRSGSNSAPFPPSRREGSA